MKQSNMKQKLTSKAASKLMAVALLSVFLSACDSIPFIDNTSDYKGAGRAKP